MTNKPKAAALSEVLATEVPGQKLQRRLQARHLEMIAIGGTIGTGLLLRSGSVIASAGPIGTLISFGLVGIQVYGVASGIGEMVTYMPIEGAFSAFPTRFVSPAFGFMCGWNYWINWSLNFPAELAGIASLMGFWISPDAIASWIWSMIYMIPIVALNCFPVHGFGEVEYVLSLIKVIAIILFLIFGILVWFGVGTGTGPLWFTNWSPAIVGSSDLSRFLNIAGCFTTAFYSYGGTELVGLTAGEAANPRYSVPRAINGTFYRILFFYIGSLLVVGLILNSGDPTLQSKDIRFSAFVQAYNKLGIHAAADVMNAIIIVAATSAANSSIYACARTLMRLAEEGSAPKLFSKVDSRGVPLVAVSAVTLLGIIAIVTAYAAGPTGSVNVFNWLSNVSGFCTMTAWSAMTFTHLRFRFGYMAQGRNVHDLPYVAPFFPYLDYLSLFIGAMLTSFLLMNAFYTNGVDAADFFNLSWFTSNGWTYCGVPFIALLYISYGFLVKDGFKVVAYSEMDFETGKFMESAEEKAANDAIGEKKSFGEWVKRLWAKK